MAEEIVHRGRIIDITAEFTSVEIVSASACSACHAKSLCGVSESKTKVIQLPTSGWESRNIGDEVDVVLKASMGYKAVWLSYVVPLFVLLAVLLVLVETGVTELVSGICAIAGVALYYLVLWLFRDRLRNEYIFNIK